MGSDTKAILDGKRNELQQPTVVSFDRIDLPPTYEPPHVRDHGESKEYGVACSTVVNQLGGRRRFKILEKICSANVSKDESSE